jgi:Zn ribbon nucleic-acid-binding protein
MADLQLPRTVAGYACPICPHCDKEYGPEVANVGPVQCDECGKWFEVTTQTVYHSEERLDYAGAKVDAPKKSRRMSGDGKPRGKRRARE